MHEARRPRSTRLLALLVATVVTAVSAACIPPDQPGPGGDGSVQVVETISGFTRPWDVQFTPDGVALVTERPGTLAALIEGERQVLGEVAGVAPLGEAGLMGLAVDPAFSTNRRIYTCQSTATDVRVVRHRVLPGYTGFTDSTPIVTGIDPGRGDRHHGCRVGFGPDGDLWVTTGDAARGSNPQDAQSLAGKVLRLRADGTPSPTNPGVANPASGWHPLVHTIGHRNIQGLAFRPSDGAVFTAEHGPGCDDEINRIVAGGNYGWNPIGLDGGYNELVPMTFAGGVTAAWSSGCPTIATSGATFLTGSLWGERQGQLVVATLRDQALHMFDATGSTVGGRERVLWGHGRLRSVTMGPDSTLWVTTDANNGSLLRVRPG